jgi:ADP-heptose:LPS heptosyltransferase
VSTRFLILRFSSIGDIVLTTPVVRCLKQQVGDAEIHFVTRLKFAPILQANPYIDKLHFIRDKIAGLMPLLEAEKFDYIIDLQNNLRSYRIKRRLGIPSFSFKKLNLKKWLLIHFKVNRLPQKHIVDRYLDTLRKFNVVNDNKGLDYFIPPGEEFNFKKLPGSFNMGYIAVVIAGTYSTKRLPVKKTLEICSRIDMPVVLVGGKKEIPEGLELIRQLKNKGLNLVGKTTLNESASVVRNAKVVLTNDTGLMHIAAAFRKKILSFWGNTVQDFGMTPYLADPASKMIEVKGLKCRPCSKLGFSRCPRKHFRCMNNVDVIEAVTWIKSTTGKVQ